MLMTFCRQTLIIHIPISVPNLLIYIIYVCFSMNSVTWLTLIFPVAASCYQEHSGGGSKLHRVWLHLPGSDLRSVCLFQLASPIMPQLPRPKVNHDYWWCDLCVSGTFMQLYTHTPKKNPTTHFLFFQSSFPSHQRFFFWTLLSNFIKATWWMSLQNSMLWYVSLKFFLASPSIYFADITA